MKNSCIFILLFLVTFTVFSQDNYRPLLNRAIKLYERGEYKESLELLVTLEEKKIKDKEVFYYMGRIYLNMEEYAKAENYYKKALELDPDYFDPYIELSTIKINQRKTDEAVAYIEKALELDPDSSIAHLNYSFILLLLNDSEKSRSEVYKAARLEPVMVMNYGMQFVLYHDKPNMTLYYLQIVEELYPKEPLVLYNSGLVYKLLEQKELADGYFKSAYRYIDQSYTSFDVIWSAYFRSLFDSQKYDQMMDILFEKVDKNYADAYFYLALIYYKQEKTEEFKKAALHYFTLEKKEVPEDLNNWAEEKCRGEE